MTSTLESTDLETPVVFGEAGEIFGIYTSNPGHGPMGAVLCLTPDMSKSPVGALLARRLAAIGIPALRFDLPGRGESLGADRGGQGSDAPFLAAIEWMRTTSLDSFVLIGGSEAARPALATASQIGDLQGVVLTRLSLRASSRRASVMAALQRKARRPFVSRRHRVSNQSAPFDWAQTVDPLVLSQLENLAEQAVPILVVSGAEDTDQVRLRRVLASGLPELDMRSLEFARVPARSLIEFKTVASQHQFVGMLVDWLDRLTIQ